MQVELSRRAASRVWPRWAGTGAIALGLALAVGLGLDPPTSPDRSAPAPAAVMPPLAVEPATRREDPAATPDPSPAPATVAASPAPRRRTPAHREAPAPRPDLDLAPAEPAMAIELPAPAPSPRDRPLELDPSDPSDSKGRPPGTLATYRPRAIREFLRVDWERWEGRALPAAVAQMISQRDSLGLLAALDGLALDSAQPELLRLRGDLRAQSRRCADARADLATVGETSPLAGCP